MANSVSLENVNTRTSFNKGGEEADFTIGDSLPSPAICVICLDLLADAVTTIPCRHNQFHLACVGTWLQQSRACPLCKAEVTAVRYRDDGGTPTYYYLPESQPTHVSKEPRPWSRHRHGRRSICSNNARSNESQVDELASRRRVYEHQQLSKYIGANRYSNYRNVTHTTMRANPTLVSKARKWIRRELRVFDFLQPASSSFGRVDRRATNPEYLLEYIVAILTSIDIKGSGGQAQYLLKDYLGTENACLFLHELDGWLRSPYESLLEWDQAVQY